MKTSINTRLMGNGLLISVDCEHETRMDHIMSASATSRDSSSVTGSERPGISGPIRSITMYSCIQCAM